jgi:hypothetical protein
MTDVFSNGRINSLASSTRLRHGLQRTQRRNSRQRHADAARMRSAAGRVGDHAYQLSSPPPQGRIKMSTAIVSIQGQNWRITPAATGPNEPAPRSFFEQKWVLVLTGVAALKEGPPQNPVDGIHGNNPHDWRRGGVRINPGAIFEATQAMMNRYGVNPPHPPNGILFSLDQWAPFVAVSSFLDLNEPPAGFGQRPSGAGAAVDLWRPVHFGDAWDVNNVPIPNVWRGIDVDVAIYGQAVLHRLSWNISLLGKIVFGNRSPDPPEPTI